MPTLTKKQRRQYQREYKIKNGYSSCWKYEKTISGFLMRAYRNMLSRVTGVQRLKAHLYKGLSILPKQEFYNWALNSKDFLKMFKTWEISGYERTITPSVNRINSNKGYELNNMEWLTHSENSRLGALNKAYGGSVR